MGKSRGVASWHGVCSYFVVFEFSVGGDMCLDINSLYTIALVLSIALKQSKSILITLETHKPLLLKHVDKKQWMTWVVLYECSFYPPERLRVEMLKIQFTNIHRRPVDRKTNYSYLALVYLPCLCIACKLSS
jgi:hypothetical protein